MSIRVIAYEDAAWRQLLPLVYMRGVFQLLCGTCDLLTRIRRLVEPHPSMQMGSRRIDQCEIWCRPEIADVVNLHTGLPANQPLKVPSLLLNGRGVWKSLPEFDDGDSAWVGTVGSDERIACVFADVKLENELAAESMLVEDRFSQAIAGLPRRDVSHAVTLLDWPWEFVHANYDQLVTDWNEDQAGIAGMVYEGAHLLNRGRVHIGWGARIKPCVVIDAEEGPVWIGENATVFPHSYIHGPAFIGDGSLIQPGAVVQGGTTIGPRSKIGGEIESSIIQGFSNKQHDGFLGHSYIGSWVNLAADCINSDLKNTYGKVRVPINGRDVESNEMFVGMFMGDYSKAGINVSFPTGTVVGFCSNVMGASSPKFIPSFTWIDGDSVQPFDEQRGLEVAKKVMGRRQKNMSKIEEQLFLAVRHQAREIEATPTKS